METKLSIRSTSIQGATRTRASVIEVELQDAYQAETVGELYSALEKAVQSLKATNSFRSVNITLAGTPDEDPALTDLIITIEEKGVLGLSANVYNNQREATAETTLQLHNVIGGCETLSIAGGAGSKSSYSAKASLTRPRFLGFPLAFEAAVDRVRSSHAEVSSHDRKKKHVGMNVRTYDGLHRAAWDLTFRDLVPLRDEKTPYSKLSSREVLYDCTKPSMKNSVSYQFTKDTRDNALSPRTGSLVKVVGESAGLLGGDVYFNSLLVTAQQYFPVGPTELFGGLPGATLALGVRVGGIVPFGVDQSQAKEQGMTGVRICDRFNAGGPLNFRGFQEGGIGPRAAPVGENKINPGGDSLGAEALGVVSMRVDVPAPIPILAVRCNAFSFIRVAHPTFALLLCGLIVSDVVFCFLFLVSCFLLIVSCFLFLVSCFLFLVSYFFCCFVLLGFWCTCPCVCQCW
jgi:outer membrane protein insertion porin family